MKRSRLLGTVHAGLLFASISLLGWSTAHASLVLEVLRVDNTTAQISGTGTIDFDTPDTYISLDGATSLGDAGFDSFTGSIDIGGKPLDAVFARNGTNDFWLSFDLNFLLSGDTITGLITATLDVETWAPVGTTGVISDGSNIQGSYTIVSSLSPVPVPAAVWLFGSGLLGLAGIARRKKAS